MIGIRWLTGPAEPIGGDSAMASVNQGAWVPGTTFYQFDFNSIPNIPITGAPADTDIARWAMLARRE